MRAIVLFVGLCCAANVLHAKPTATKPASPTEETSAKADDKAIEPEAKIEGVVIERPDGSFVGVTIDGGTFKLSFYDKKKKPMAVDVTRATARWSPKQKAGDDRTVLNRGGDPNSLGGGKPVRPPYVFKLYLTLLRGEGDGAEAVESYVVDFRA